MKRLNLLTCTRAYFDNIGVRMSPLTPLELESTGPGQGRPTPIVSTLLYCIDSSRPQTAPRLPAPLKPGTLFHAIPTIYELPKLFYLW